MIISSNLVNLRGQTYSSSSNSPIKNNSQHTKNTYSSSVNCQNKGQVSFGVFVLDDILIVAGGMIISKIVSKAIDYVGKKIVQAVRPTVAPTKLTESAERHAEEAIEKTYTKIATSINRKATEQIERLEAKGEKPNPQHIKEEHLKLMADKLTRVYIPLEEDNYQGYERGLNKVIGFATLKTGIYEDVLMPLCDVMDGKSRHHYVPNGICLFGPMGTGKSYFARQLGDHYVRKGGYFEEFEELTGDVPTDIKYIKTKFAEAKKRFEESDHKKYTMFLLDEVEKMFDRNNPTQRPVMGTLLRLVNDCKDNGAIFMTTANYLDKVEPALLRNGRTDIRIPLGYIEDVDLADMTHYYIKKDRLPAGDIDYKKVLEAVRTEKLQYKPKDVETCLKKVATDYEDTGEKLSTGEVIKALKKAKIDFDSEINTQFKNDKAYANQTEIGGIYEY